jgi:hypothetical protein
VRCRWLLPLLAIFLGGCRNPSTGPLLLGRGVPFVLRSPSEGPRLFVTQEVLFQLPGDREERLLTSLENDADHLSIVASSPMGQTLFTLQLRQGIVTVDARVPLPKEFDTRLLPALIQLANWPLEDLRKGLEADASLQEVDQIRSLRRKGRIVLTLQREGTVPPYRKIVLELPSASMRAIITTLEELP